MLYAVLQSALMKNGSLIEPDGRGRSQRWWWPGLLMPLALEWAWSLWPAVNLLAPGWWFLSWKPRHGEKQPGLTCRPALQ